MEVEADHRSVDTQYGGLRPSVGHQTSRIGGYCLTPHVTRRSANQPTRPHECHLDPNDAKRDNEQKRALRPPPTERPARFDARQRVAVGKVACTHRGGVVVINVCFQTADPSLGGKLQN